MNARERKLAELSLHIDRLGRLQGEQRRLEDQVKRLKNDILKDMSALRLKHASGELFGATHIVKIVNRVDYKTIVQKLKPSFQMVAAHTKASRVEYVQLGTRKAEVA